MAMKRKQLSAWDLALLDKLVSREITAQMFTGGNAYVASLKDLQQRLSLAKRGTLTGEW